jgi:hypothetical protein
MRRFWLVFLLSAVTVATAGAEVSRSDLAPATQSFLPPKASVITLKQGYTIQGEILADESSSDEVAVRVTTGTIVSKRRYPKADIVSAKPENLEAVFAKALKSMHLSPKTNLTASAYTAALALFDDFLAHWPTSDEAAAFTRARAEFAAERGKLTAGLEKVEGAWMPPITSSGAAPT